MPIATTLPLRATAQMLASFYIVASLLGAAGLAQWAGRAEEGSAQRALEPPLDGWARLCTAIGATGLDRSLLAWTAARVADVAADSAGDDVAAGQLAGLLAAAEQVAEHESPVSPLPAPAQPRLAAAMPAAQGPAPVAVQAPEASTRTVLLTGDSLMAVGLAQGIAQVLRDDPAFALVRGYRSATGLSRPDYFDWPGALKSYVRKYRPDVVLVAMGGNDAQGFRSEGKVLHFATPAWDKAYRDRVAEFLRIARSSGAKVLWIGAPTMRTAAFTTSMGRLNRLVREAMVDVGGCEYLDPTPFITASGQFAAYLPDGRGRQTKVRTDDGVHMTNQGAVRVATGVANWLRR